MFRVFLIGGGMEAPPISYFFEPSYQNRCPYGALLPPLHLKIMPPQRNPPIEKLSPLPGNDFKKKKSGKSKIAIKTCVSLIKNSLIKNTEKVGRNSTKA